MKKEDIDFRRFIFGVCATAAGIVAAVFCGGLATANDALASLVGTIFSVLAGFLIAIFTLLGEPVMLLPGSWRLASEQRDELGDRLWRHSWTFYVYMATLVGVLVYTLTKPPASDSVPCLAAAVADSDATLRACVSSYAARIYFGFAVIGFLLSFRLPGALIEISRDRLEATIRVRKKLAPAQIVAEES